MAPLWRKLESNSICQWLGEVIVSVIWVQIHYHLYIHVNTPLILWYATHHFGLWPYMSMATLGSAACRNVNKHQLVYWLFFYGGPLFCDSLHLQSLEWRHLVFMNFMSSPYWNLCLWNAYSVAKFDCFFFVPFNFHLRNRSYTLYIFE